jgi:hypothetical protein
MRKNQNQMRRNQKMRRVILTLVTFVAAIACFAPCASAQDHGQVGAFIDYLRLAQTGNTSFVGLGGRAAFNINRYIGFEAEMAYDFDQVFSEGFTPSGGGSVTVARSNFRILDGLFGPTLSTGHGPVRLFVTVKGGFVNFRFDPRPPTFDTFSSSVTDLRSNNWDGALYPGGGIEGFIGPVGLRLDAGDEIYFNAGMHNNLRVTFGPSIRF